MNDRKSSDPSRDLYFEEVGMFADATLDKIKAGEIKTKHQAIRDLELGLDQCSYCVDEYLCAVALTWSDFPTAYFAHYGFNTQAEEIGPDGRTPFPWGRFAAAAMVEDVKALLEQDDAYTSLPEGNDGEEDPEDDDPDDEEDEDDADGD